MPGTRNDVLAAASEQRGCAPCLDARRKTHGERSCAAAALADRLTLFLRSTPSAGFACALWRPAAGVPVWPFLTLTLLLGI